MVIFFGRFSFIFVHAIPEHKNLVDISRTWEVEQVYKDFDRESTGMVSFMMPMFGKWCSLVLLDPHPRVWAA